MRTEKKAVILSDRRESKNPPDNRSVRKTTGSFDSVLRTIIMEQSPPAIVYPIRYAMLRMTRLLAAFLALAMLLSLCGCHGHREQDIFAIPEEFDTSRDYEITFWAKNDTNLTQVAIYKQAIEDFEALYPNIKVTLKLYTDYGRLYNDVITNIATVTTPNVCISYPDHIATYLEGENTVVALDDLLTHEKYGLGGTEVKFDAPQKDEMVEKFLNECRIGDTYYALPFMRSTEACYVNKDYVEKLGYTLPETLTWDFIWEVSNAAAKKNEDGTYALNGQKVMIPFIYKSTDNMMIQMLRQQGAGYSTSGGTIDIFNETTEEILYTIADNVKTGAFCTFKIVSYPADYLNAGQCVFAVESTAGANWMGSDAPMLDISEDKLVEFENVVMEIPQYDPENPQMISQGPSVCVFNKEDDQEVLASWLFAQYLLTNEVQIAYAQTEGYVPVTSKALESAEYQDYLSRSGEDNELYYSVKLDAAKLLLENIDNTFVTPVFNGSTSLRNAAGQMVENVTKAVRRKQEINDEFMENLYADVTALYRLDQIETVPGGDLGPLPTASVFLLGSIAVCWVILGGVSLYRKIKERNKS